MVLAILAAATMVGAGGRILSAQTGSGGVVHVAPDQVAAALAKGGSLVARPDLLVSGSHRTAAGQVEVHDRETDVLYITDGTAVFAWGGTMVGGKVSGPGQWLGTGITGGESQQVGKGDVFVVPAGTPHWFKEVPTSVSYFVVKVLKP
jgi:mannose-6-phosphate isomerase-like protein (cupin superfamily)